MISKPELRQLPVDMLTRGQFQPRRQFDQTALAELAQSIKVSGIIQPIIVRPLTRNVYEIVAGERRWRAAQLAGLANVPCLINNYTDEQTIAVTTVENINRVDLNPIEEADAYQRLIDEFHYLHEEVAAIVGKSRVKITNSLRLLKLESAIKKLLIEGKITEGHGKVLVGLPGRLQMEIAQKCIANSWSVRRVEQEVKKALSQTHKDFAEKSPDIERLEMDLSDHMGCQVTIDYIDKKGQLKIDFHNLEILDGLLSKFGFR